MLRPAVLALSLSTVATAAFAHHGGGTFDLRSSVTFPMATLTKVELINPHSWLYFEVKEPDGKISKHRCEMRSAHVLRRSGWTEGLLPAGAKVRIEASPDRADPASCYLQTILFENGNRMDRYGQYVKGPGGAVTEVRGELPVAVKKRDARRSTGEPNISGDWAPEQVVMADPRGVGGGLVRLSTIPPKPGERQTQAVLVVAARRAGARGARPGRGSMAAPSSRPRASSRRRSSRVTTTRVSSA
jgi:hypothetical protein